MKIGLIGDENELIGYGLVGMDHLWQVDYNAPKEVLQETVKKAEKAGVETLFISESHFEKISNIKTKIFLIPLPTGVDDGGAERIAQLTKEILGIKI